MRLLECPWLQQQHKSSVEACIRTLAMVGKEPRQSDALFPTNHHPWPLWQRAGAIVPTAGPGDVLRREAAAGNGEIWLQDVLFFELRFQT